jgi:salicylate 1-O-methyltransferase
MVAAMPSSPQSSVVVRPEPMESATYTSSSRLQAAGLLPAVALFAQAAEQVPLPELPQPIVIADYGSATGHNSLKPMSAAIQVLRRRTRQDHAIVVTHTDVPDNDFTALFRILAEDPDSYLHHDAASFPSAIGRSFYSQILPSNTVNLGWSSWAIQWLSRIPAGAPEFADHVQVAYSKNTEARAAYARQAAIDWNDFVAFRGRELCPDGRLVVLTMAVDEHGEFGYRAMNDALYATLNDLVSDGLLHRDELRRMTLPVYARDEKDFRAPFSPKGRFEGLTIEHLEIFNADDRFWARFQSDGDAEAFGAQWAAFARAALFPTLASALDGGAGNPRVPEFFAQLEAGIAQRLASSPEPMRIPLASLVLVKRGLR